MKPLLQDHSYQRQPCCQWQTHIQNGHLEGLLISEREQRKFLSFTKLCAAQTLWLHFALWQWLSHLQTNTSKREWMFRCRWSKHIHSCKYPNSCSYRPDKESREQISLCSKHPVATQLRSPLGSIDQTSRKLQRS